MIQETDSGWRVPARAHTKPNYHSKAARATSMRRPNEVTVNKETFFILWSHSNIIPMQSGLAIHFNGLVTDLRKMPLLPIGSAAF